MGFYFGVVFRILKYQSAPSSWKARMCKSSNIITQSRAQPTAIKNGVDNGLSVQPSQNYTSFIIPLYASPQTAPRARPHLLKVIYFVPDGKSTSVFV